MRVRRRHAEGDAVTGGESASGGVGVPRGLAVVAPLGVGVAG